MLKDISLTIVCRIPYLGVFMLFVLMFSRLEAKGEDWHRWKDRGREVVGVSTCLLLVHSF